jgi:DNA recombination protein RmuC
MQLSVTDGETSKRLRPDAVVFLPSESVLVVDSKASKFLYDIAKAEGGGDEQAAYDRFASTMNTHLKSLSEKDYKNAIVEAYAKSGRQGDVRRVMSVMALPSDSALEKLYRADPDFPKKAAERQIIPVGPAGLSCIVGFARVEIDTGRQIDNQEKIIRSVQRLLDGIAVSLGHALSIGTSIKGAADNFAKFAASVNKTLLPRAQALPQLGVRSEKALPMSLPAIQVIGLETHTTIEAEAEDDGGMALPQPKQ